MKVKLTYPIILRTSRLDVGTPILESHNSTDLIAFPGKILITDPNGRVGEFSRKISPILVK